MIHIRSLIFLGLLIGLSGSFLEGRVSAEPQIIKLPGDYSDFAIDPATGDIAALDAQKNRAFLFRQTDLKQDRLEPSAELRVGSTPCSICFKRYGDLNLFAVVCTQDSHMYLINTKDFSLLEKVSLASSGVSQVTTSRNPLDPFLYYNYGSGHGSSAGAVSLRDKRDRGQVFDHAMDCAISADGLVAYRRGPWSPSGFESLLCTSGLSVDKPVFARLFYDHESTSAYLPGPFGRVVATGTRIHSRSLEKLEGNLDFVPLAFSTSRPVIFGTSSLNGTTAGVIPSRRSSTPTSKTVRLQAASYNTLTPVGKPVSFRLALSPASELPRGVPGHSDFKRIAPRERIFAEESRDQVAYAYRNSVVFVPIKDFELPDEPFLLPRLKGPEKLEIGKTYELRLQSDDPRVKLTVVDQPDDVTQDGEVLKWTPNAEQVGEATFRVKSVFQDIQANFEFTREVVYPSLTLPFAAGNIKVLNSGDVAVVWTVPNNSSPRSPTQPAEEPRAAVVDLKEGKVLAQREIGYPFQDVWVSQDRLFVLQTSNTMRFEIWDAKTLKQERTFAVAGPIQQVETHGNMIVVRTSRGTEIFDAKTFRRLYDLSETRQIVTRQGLLINGVLHDENMKPKLIVSRQGLTSLPGADERWANQAFESATPPTTPSQNYRSPIPINNQVPTTLGMKKIPGTNLTASLTLQTTQLNVPRATHTWRRLDELLLQISGGENQQRLVLSRITQRSQTAHLPNASPAILATVPGTAFVLQGDQLYRWDVPQEAIAKNSLPADSSKNKLQWDYEQSSFWVSGTDNTTLKHTLQGGTKPIRMELVSVGNALSLDPRTGDVTVDGKAILAEAKKVLLESLSGLASHRQPYPVKDRLEQSRTIAAKKVQEMTGKAPEGFPVAMPVCLEAKDKDGAEATLQYYVFVDVPVAEIVKPFEEMVEERKRQMEAARQTPARVERPNNDVDQLKKRVDSLEQQLDLVTRQLNQVLKKLDEMEKK